jgi:hypothetical protein
MSASKAYALLRLERVEGRCDALLAAYREGELSWAQANALLSVLLVASPERWGAAWIAWARRVTVRRLEDDVDRALVVCDTDPERFRATGGLPPESREEAPDARASDTPAGVQTRAKPMDLGSDAPRDDGADRRPVETARLFFPAPPDVARLLRATLCTVRRRLQRERQRQGLSGRLPTDGEALEVMLDYVLGEWGDWRGRRLQRFHVFERDGWRCTVPGCTSYRNLQAHHIEFASAGGSDEPENLVTLCAFHHHRGVHAGRLRITGRAPENLRFELGRRAGQAPLETFQSGDLRVRRHAATRRSPIAAAGRTDCTAVTAGSKCNVSRTNTGIAAEGPMFVFTCTGVTSETTPEACAADERPAEAGPCA